MSIVFLQKETSVDTSNLSYVCATFPKVFVCDDRKENDTLHAYCNNIVPRDEELNG
ncbi:2770_t:CDS:2 [Paraglomus occultum]|uniref:2770_t:CDS:1 n=1 Tax=Paraglomus occultum TaxID=144539 RepID=A0A9N9G1A1_9GLOM|nr:2770_t:CDS:2 [Paraglomus occultum]